MTAVDVRFAQGAAGSEAWPVDDGHPDPQTNALTDTQLRAVPVAVETELTQPLTDAQLRAAAVPVSGTVSVVEPVTVDGTVSVPGVATETSLADVKSDIDNRYGGGKAAYSGVLSTSGDNTVIAPASGRRIRVFWVAFVPNSDNSAANLVAIKIGSTTYYTGYAMAHWEIFTGAANDTVTVNLQNTQPVAITLHYQEID